MAAPTAFRNKTGRPPACGKKARCAWKDNALKGFQLYFDTMPAEWKEEILESGMTPKVYDRLVLLHQEHASRQEDLHYEDDVRSWECKINDYNFRLISSIHRFQQVFLNMSYSLHSHRKRTNGTKGQ